jgi:NAD(P)-dependent dehydrogenase (short-subunit alcohol dehydrogenase family)
LASAAPSLMLEGKTVLIAGVGKGLGSEVADVAFREGAKVVLGARTESVVEEIADELDPTRERALPIPLDVTDRENCAGFAAAAAERYGQVDVVVCLAALDYVFGGVEGANWDDWHKMMEVNLFGTLYMIEASVPHYPASGGSVVVVGSQSMFDPPPWMPQAGYAASKGAVVGAMRHITHELGRKKIRINNVVPGWMWGPPVEEYVSYRANKKGIPEEEVLAQLTKPMALGEMATDGDVAEAIIFFASERAHGITGQSLLVNAGEHMH